MEKSSPQSAVVTTVKASTAPSMWAVPSRPRLAGRSANRPRRIHWPKTMPAAAPTAASTRPSTRPCRVRRPKPAPSAMRTAVSRARLAARATSRLATLTQAMARRIATPANRASSAGRISRTPSACSATVVKARPATPYSGNSREIVDATPSISRRAWSTVTPGFIRPTTRRYCWPRAPRVIAFGLRGTQAWRSSGTLASGGIQRRKSSGMTPTTVTGRPFISIRRPTMPGSPPYRPRQTEAASTIAFGAPFCDSSSLVNVRPSAASAPSSVKKFVVTSPMRSCSGSPSPVSAALVAQMAPKPEKCVVRSRRSWTSGPESGARGYPPLERSHQTKTSWEGSRNGRGASSIACTTLNSAVLAPMPRARVSIATAAKPGDRRNWRSA